MHQKRLPRVGGSLQRSSHLLAGFKIRGRDKGQRKGERQEGIDSWGRGTEERREGQEGKGTELEWEENGWKQKTHRGVQRQSQRRKMRHRNPRGTKIRKLGSKFKFGQMILSIIVKIVASRCHILRLKCTKFDFGCGSAPDPSGGVHSTLPGP